MSNIALSTLDEHFARAWEAMGDQAQRAARRRQGEVNYRITRYADDFVVCVAGDRRHAEALIAETERAIAPLGLTLSREKTRVAHIDEGIDFLGWRIQRHRGSNGRRYVYTYPSKRALAYVKTKVKTITQTGHNQTLDQLVHRLNPVLRGWCAYFRPGVSSRTFNYLRAYTWRRVVRWLRRKHPKANGGGCDAATYRRTIESREVLEQRVAELAILHDSADLPLLDAWGGFRVVSGSFELWQHRADRLHDRLRYTRGDDGRWRVQRLAP